jgi:hypothetical protein
MERKNGLFDILTRSVGEGAAVLSPVARGIDRHVSFFTEDVSGRVSGMLALRVQKMFVHGRMRMA